MQLLDPAVDLGRDRVLLRLRVIDQADRAQRTGEVVAHGLRGAQSHVLNRHRVDGDHRTAGGIPLVDRH